MATNPIGREAQSVTQPCTIPLRPAVAHILSRCDRGELADLVTVAIDLLDVLDGDPDQEEDDDGGDWASEDHPGARPYFVRTGPGCPISDPGEND